MSSAALHHYRVHLHSAPSTGLVFYSCYVDVTAECQEDAFPAAVRKLARTSFADRPGLSSWRLERVEARP